MPTSRDHFGMREITDRLIDLLGRGRAVLVLAIAACSVYAVMVGLTLPQLRILGGGVEPFDMSPAGFDLDHARALLGNLGPDGRSYYLTWQIPLDTLYPGLMALTLAGLWLWLLRRVSSHRHAPVWLAWLPVLAGLCDYAENGLIVAMLVVWPDLPSGLVRAASLATMAKSGLTTLSFMALLVLLGLMVIHRRRAGQW